MLVRNITTRVEIPDEPGSFAVIRKLTWKQLESAQERRSDVGMQKMKAAGGELLESITRLRNQATPIDKGEAKADGTVRPDLLLTYDLESLLSWGVADLSYVENFKSADVLDLDAKTAKFLGREILKWSEVIPNEEAEKNV